MLQMQLFCCIDVRPPETLLGCFCTFDPSVFTLCTHFSSTHTDDAVHVAVGIIEERHRDGVLASRYPVPLGGGVDLEHMGAGTEDRLFSARQDTRTVRVWKKYIWKNTSFCRSSNVWMTRHTLRSSMIPLSVHVIVWHPPENKWKQTL